MIDAHEPTANREPFVVAVSSVSGRGKTTLVQKASALLGASTMFFDDCRDSSEYPEDVLKWVDRGADLNEWETPEFANDLSALMRGERVRSPGVGTDVAPTEFIVIEERMGRGRAEMAESIDFVALIDTPLEIALARRSARTMQPISLDGAANATNEELAGALTGVVECLRSELRGYLNASRALYIAVQEQVEADYDLVLDGRLPADELAEKLVEAVKAARDSE